MVCTICVRNILTGEEMAIFHVAATMLGARQRLEVTERFFVASTRDWRRICLCDSYQTDRLVFADGLTLFGVGTYREGGRLTLAAEADASSCFVSTGRSLLGSLSKGDLSK